MSHDTHPVQNSASTTIAAIASPAGPGERGVIRVSGQRARELVQAIWRDAPAPSSSPAVLPVSFPVSIAAARPHPTLDLTRRGSFRGRFADARGTQPLLLLWMPGPRSFTREDIAEFHLPGSPPLLAAALARLVELGATPARPGEFTRRAFLSGRIDLTRAEGVLALVHAGNEAEARSARALLFGGLEDRVRALRDELDTLRALCEASLDFDESDTGHVPVAELERGLASIERLLDAALAFETQRARGAGLPRVVLVGAPNAGKSRLFNALLDDERALVSDLSGTTRDALSAQLEIDGRALTLFDTAGFDDFARGPDRTAQELARGAHATADVLVWVVDAAEFGPRVCAEPRVDEPHSPASLRAETQRDAMLRVETQRDAILRVETLRAERARLGDDVPIVLAWNKTDLVSNSSRALPGHPAEHVHAAEHSHTAEHVHAAEHSHTAEHVHTAEHSHTAMHIHSAEPVHVTAQWNVAAQVHVSGLTRFGLADLRRVLVAALEARPETGGLEREVLLRHERGLVTAQTEVRAARVSLRSGRALELSAEHLRRATAGLDDLAGTTTAEDVLDRIFARFCLGK